MLYQDASKYVFHEFINARDRYIHAMKTLDKPRNNQLLNRYVERQLVLLSPLVPHLTDHMWHDVLKKVCQPTRLLLGVVGCC